jgi:hypothetical protein
MKKRWGDELEQTETNGKDAKMGSWTRNTETYEKQEQPRRGETEVLLRLMEIDKKNWS